VSPPLCYLSSTSFLLSVLELLHTAAYCLAGWPSHTRGELRHLEQLRHIRDDPETRGVCVRPLVQGTTVIYTGTLSRSSRPAIIVQTHPLAHLDPRTRDASDQRDRRDLRA
jgi:hypothetical protein